MSAKDTNNQRVDVVFDPQNMDFDGNGHIIQPTNGLINVTASDAVGPQFFTFDIRKLTQFSFNKKQKVNNIDQDGYSAGRF
jgi:hypothetical protein